jgi:hypothetical protein
MSHPANQALVQALSDGTLKGASNATIFKRGHPTTLRSARAGTSDWERPGVVTP